MQHNIPAYIIIHLKDYHINIYSFCAYSIELLTQGHKVLGTVKLMKSFNSVYFLPHDEFQNICKSPNTKLQHILPQKDS